MINMYSFIEFNIFLILFYKIKNLRFGQLFTTLILEPGIYKKGFF